MRLTWESRNSKWTLMRGQLSLPSWNRHVAARKGLGPNLAPPSSPLTISCWCKHLALSSLALSNVTSVTTQGEGLSESGLLFGETDLREYVQVSSHHR